MNNFKHIIFTGAGVSVASGLGTFRGSAAALWENFDPNVVCNYDTVDRNREKVFDFYNMRKEQYRDAQPNAAHHIVTELQKHLGATVYTSNVDLLHEAAGTTGVKHVHGDMGHMMCMDCDHVWEIGSNLFDLNEVCPHCASPRTKPGVVFFGESAPLYADLGEDVYAENSIKIVIGTSLNVVGPYALGAQAGRGSIFIDPQSEQGEGYFTHLINAKAEEIDIAEVLSVITAMHN